MNLTADDKEKLFNKLDHIETRIEKVERGMYGDPDNGYTGVIKDMGEIKRFKATMTKVGAGLSTVISVVISAIAAIFKHS